MKGWRFYTSSVKDKTIFFPASGYRNYSNGNSTELVSPASVGRRFHTALTLLTVCTSPYQTCSRCTITVERMGSVCVLPKNRECSNRICFHLIILRLCQNAGTTFFIITVLLSFLLSMPLFPHYLLTSCYILPLYRVINSPINIDLGNVMTSFLTFLSFAHIFWILKTMVKKTKFIVTLSSSTCWNLLYAILYSIV